MPCPCDSEARLSDDLYADIRQVIFRLIPDIQPANHRYVILLHGKIDHRYMLKIDFNHR